VVQLTRRVTLYADNPSRPLFFSFGASSTNSKIPLDKSIYLYKYMPMPELLHLDLAFAALADPTRRAILARLAKGEATVMELAEPFNMTQPAVSQHLRVLEDAGLVVHRVEGAKRPRRLVKAGIDAMDQWLAMLRKALEANYNRLDEVLASMEQKNGEKKKGETQ
jgi:DNA-binding transcriptional ArsR family regulator